MLTTLLARTAQMTAAIVSAALLTAYVTVVPVPARAQALPAVAAEHR